MANTKKTAAVKTTETKIETKKEEVSKTTEMKEVKVCRNVICKYGVFESGKTYKVNTETEKKLIGLGAI